MTFEKNFINIFWASLFKDSSQPVSSELQINLYSGFIFNLLFPDF